MAALGTFADIEDLTAEIGDELTRRADEMAETNIQVCPDCGKNAKVEAELEPLILQGQRGEIEYSEPVCYCTRCRVSFFPLAGELKRPPRELVTPRVMEKVVWAGTHHGSFAAAAESIEVLAEQSLSAKQVRRITTYVGEDRVAERRDQIAEFTNKTLTQTHDGEAGCRVA